MVTPRQDDWNSEERETLGNLCEELRELRERHKDDPPLELLRAARAGALPEELQKAAEEYLERSAWGRALVEGTDTADAALDSREESQLLARLRIETRESGRPPIALFSFWRLAVASTAALAIASAVFLWRYDFRSGRTLAPPKPPVAAESTEHAPTVPPTLAFMLPLEKPQIKLSAAALLYRGSPENNRFLEDLAPAVKAFRAEDYSEAEKDFAALAPRYPKSAEVLFYLGVSRLFMGDAQGAIHALEPAGGVGDGSFAPDISWYLAVAYERAGRSAEARSQLDSLCRGKSLFAARACASVEKLRQSPPH